MKEQLAQQIAARFEAAWPGKVTGQVKAAPSLSENGYSLVLHLHASGRHIHIGREQVIDGVEDICMVLLGGEVRQVEILPEEQEVPQPTVAEQPEKPIAARRKQQVPVGYDVKRLYADLDGIRRARGLAWKQIWRTLLASSDVPDRLHYVIAGRQPLSLRAACFLADWAGLDFAEYQIEEGI